MIRIHAGARLERPPGPKYLDALDFAELQLVGPLPKPSTLARWADDLPGSLTLSFVAPKPAMQSDRGPLRFDETMEAAFEWTLEASAALRARFVVLETGPHVTTGQRDRDLMAAWIERWTGDARVVWQPAGLWDPELAAPFARKLGVIQSFDPLEAMPGPTTALVYARMRAMGMRQRFGETELLEVVDSLAAAPPDAERFVAIASERSFDEARRLVQLAELEDDE
ncbi:MAG TPA: hypothetical protein RMH99_09165 [Sandaracinaceae bacterium LLY-WYZ-13_1]|nr:hypothetical protein [Sandaracinaceae bacterium LLY-WYZ-13_1]